MTLEAQEDLLILEKERNLELQKLIDEKDEEIEDLTKELALVNFTMEERKVELFKANNSIVDLKSANETLQSNISSLKIQCQELEVQLDTLKKANSYTSSTKIDSSSSTSNGCKRCFNHDINACATNLDKIGILENKVKLLNNMIREEMFVNKDGSRKVETKYKPMINNQGKKGLGHNSHVVNPSVENKRWKSPKFVKSTNLYDALGRIHSSNIIITQDHKKINKEKSNTRTTTNGDKAPIPNSNSYLCDYMLTWDQGKMVVKYVGAYAKRKAMRRSVWVPKALVTNLKGPNSFWVPKYKA